MPYTLIIAEKPSAAKRIAEALAQSGVDELDHGVKSYKITRNGKEIVVAPAVGHLFGLIQSGPNSGWTYPVFDVEWKPTFENGKTALWSKKYYKNLESITKGADKFVASCDYDVEGSVIGYNILRFICKTEKAARMRFSTLTKGDIEKAFDEASDELDFPQIEAGLARHTMDFFWGINLSRALTLSLRAAGGYKTLSTGRVQGPTLGILSKRQKEIMAFKPTPYWEILLTSSNGKEDILANHEKGKFWEKDEASGIHKVCQGKDAKVSSIDTKQHKQNPPLPFDLTSLQRESYGCFGYSPKMTLDVAQSLYEQALISYPRTSSQELHEKLGLKAIIKNLGNQKDYGDLCEKLLKKKKLIPTKGKKKDPAHPAIYPTGQRPKGLNSYQRKLYDLIVKRFLSVFGDPAIRETVKAGIDVNGEKFIAEGIRTIEPNWMEFYMPYAKFKETILPKLNVGDNLENKSVDMLDKETQPPKRFTQAAILKEMESLGLGTKATRAQILETLYNRGYIEDKNIIVTELGMKVVEALALHSPEVISVNLTKDFEKDLEAIQEGKKKKEEIISTAKDTLGKILENFKLHEVDIGKLLLKVVIDQHRQENTIGKCKCGSDLVIRRSKKGARFVGCTGYPKCTETFSLPHFGMVKVIKEECEKCGLNVVMVKAQGKRPWKLCVKCGFIGGKNIAGKPKDDEGEIAPASEKVEKKTAKKPAKKTVRKKSKK